MAITPVPQASSIEIEADLTICGCNAKRLDLNFTLPDGTMIHECPRPKGHKKVLLAAWYKNPVKNLLVNLQINLRRRSPWRPY